MTRQFIVEDNSHCETLPAFPTMDAAREEVRRLFELPWDEEPNRCPCMSWRTCSREWLIVEYEIGDGIHQRIGSTGVLCEVGSAGARWLGDDEPTA